MSLGGGQFPTKQKEKRGNFNSKLARFFGVVFGERPTLGQYMNRGLKLITRKGLVCPEQATRT